MIAADFGPVVHELILVLVFDQRAVATGRIQTVAKVSKRAIKLKRRETTSGCIASVQPIQPQRLRGRDVSIRLDRMRIVFEPTESEVGKQCGADGLVESRRQAMVVNDGAAAQAPDSSTLAAQPDTQNGLPI